ncbi:hypothetical protein E8E11_007642 [Didymella keratinophila]|nr:hypothetical protein E8E11_007642 [Didymella keratinophila]
MAHEELAARTAEDSPLLILPNDQHIDLATGYIPLLTNFTHEDKAAKGLRKSGPDAVLEPPIHFTALELVRDNRLLLLSGPTGSGKTTFAKWICQWLASQRKRIANVVRNEFGDVCEERWDAKGMRPYYFTIESPESVEKVVDINIAHVIKIASSDDENERTVPLLVLDIVEKAGPAALSLVTEATRIVGECSHAKLLILCDSDVSSPWQLPQDLAQHTLLSLLQTQRRLAVDQLLNLESAKVKPGTGSAAANAAIFSIALQAEAEDNAEEIVDKWLSKVTTGAVDIARLEKAPMTWHSVVQSLLFRIGDISEGHLLINGLITRTGLEAQRGALLVSELSIANSTLYKDQIRRLMLNIITQATLPLHSRVKAGNVLSRLDDPRDIQALAHIPAGTSSTGCDTHPNSQPIHAVTLEAFRIGIFPVGNKHYSDFTQATNQPWHSPAADAPEQLNHPATDLTWHDANAYCSWLTTRWRQGGKISQNERVRLPTEAEWERAARGDLVEKGSGAPTYPWGNAWHHDAANSEEAGLNAPYSVGLFPGYGSQYGCLDMVGQVWKWCSTLWGEDMGTPSFKYPYRKDDGREAKEAPPAVRRVLRGGSFSSGAPKANCTYRGSLEPAGYWRGNGFRIVVAKD